MLQWIHCSVGGTEGGRWTAETGQSVLFAGMASGDYRHQSTEGRRSMAETMGNVVGTLGLQL